jgi:hypothetical protein
VIVAPRFAVVAEELGNGFEPEVVGEVTSSLAHFVATQVMLSTSG